MLNPEIRIDVRIPFRPGGQLGLEYNHIMSETNCGWVLFLDHDVFLCNPHWYLLCTKAIEQDSEAGLFTCWTNNIGNTMQKDVTAPTSADISDHTIHARSIFDKYQYSITRIDKASGMFLLINKDKWRKVGGFPGNGIFQEDWKFTKLMNKKGIPLYRIDGLYIYHKRDRKVGSWIETEKTTKELRDEIYAEKIK